MEADAMFGKLHFPRLPIRPFFQTVQPRLVAMPFEWHSKGEHLLDWMDWMDWLAMKLFEWVL